MKTQSLRWRFVNQSNPAETVLVHDQGSAETLATLLQKMGGDWMMQEERPIGAFQTPAAQPSPQVQPQTAATVQPAPVVQAAPVVESPPIVPAPPPVAETVAPVPAAPAPVAAAPVASAPVPVAPAPVEAAPVTTAPEASVESVEIEDESDVDQYEETFEEESAEDRVVVQPAEDRRIIPPPAPPKKEQRRTKERRSQPRFMTEFRVILISGSSSFRTMSQDVSLGGMRLKKTIPASFLQEKCIAYVSHKDLRENIEMVCHVVGDPSDPCRIQFLQPNQNQLKRLSDWLLEHTANSKKAAS